MNRLRSIAAAVVMGLLCGPSFAQALSPPPVLAADTPRRSTRGARAARATTYAQAKREAAKRRNVARHKATLTRSRQ